MNVDLSFSLFPFIIRGNRWSYKQMVPTSKDLLSGRHIKIVAPNVRVQFTLSLFHSLSPFFFSFLLSSLNQLLSVLPLLISGRSNFDRTQMSYDAEHKLEENEWQVMGQATSKEVDCIHFHKQGRRVKWITISCITPDSCF